jgi:succinate-semialdehyde dehydrogenase/glutarate-semialdehyde dehydrogenase
VDTASLLAETLGDDWAARAAGGGIAVHNPATDALITHVPRDGVAEAEKAIARASEAWSTWRKETAGVRGRKLRRFSDLMLEHQENLAQLLTLEQGKPIAEARGEIRYAASFLDWAAEEGKRIYGELIPGSRADQRIMVMRQPVGVTAAITPWNFPSAMITRKLGPALAAGCTMVVKPAEQTPLSAIALLKLARDAGIPENVFQIITGDPEPIGQEFLRNPSVRKISFTGSTEVGKLLMAGAAQNVTRISLELGGHAPFIVFDDADLDAAIIGAMISKYRNMGQTCICANRFLIQEGIYDAFVDRLEAEVSSMQIGDGCLDGVTVGPLIDDAAVAKVHRHIEDAVEKGATVRCGGQLQPMDNAFSDRFFQPTILEGVRDEMIVCQEETFGPVAPIRRFTTEAEAIALANNSSYGLAAYFYTRDAGRLMRVAEALEYGIIGANDGGPSTPQAPFGGMKQSGLGREGGRYVMDEYVEVKFVSWKV